MGRFRHMLDKPKETEGFQFEWFGNNRVLCDVLEDMRKVVAAHTGHPGISILKGLIEEAQVMGNRMECALRDQKDLISINEAMSTARKAYKKLEREYKALEAKVEPRRPKRREQS